ncbi:hypothetical protein HBI49_204750 [Parastagonospora nodorum]|nr:hypothetical protein HBH50_244670 [Parastagonospora nodorum]KAH4077307.1 hypothetical protein HBH48_244620 [Parastagonospora nodorum]KAH5207720.1 hypothetical protein HBI62_224640 [Parastagonospora nodorum]KAH5347792.1 hypothetical protein HBI49_204750 [Parastagonospora nodorum]KAH5390771.1 hypothetical protein HBI32_242240 [Parastagonospora nodorum]
MATAPESEKAQRYLQQLDEARCAGRWQDIPELCRKVEKHAPHRKCLTTTSRSEAQIAAYSAQRPSTAASTASHNLSQIIPTLLTTIETENETSQDAFQAHVCLGWLHYVLDEPGLAVAHLPKDFRAATASMSEGGTLTGWSRVCVVKGTYLRGSAQEKTGAMADALATYSSVMPWLSSTSTPESAQSKMWTENLLVRLCHLSDQSSDASDIVTPTDALRTYRYWGRHWEATSKGAGHEVSTAAHHRRRAWKAYYDSLSRILQQGLPYEAEPAPASSEKPPLLTQTSLRLRQRAELKRVETVYEGLLIKETQFPRASEINHEVEAWVDSVMANWRLLCGPTWTDADLGEGGKEGVARSVLDILYRAATKTFHSTQVLRNLFVVHASLAEFDLAFKAYDSYVEIITRGKDRVEKSGEAVEGIDDDSTVLRTSAEAVRLLCRFGSRHEAETALEIGHSIERWLEQSEHIRSASDAGSVASVDTIVEPTALAAAFCAIGISQAHWARHTYEVEQRAVFQAKAVQHLRQSLSPGLGDSNNVDALYALALVLAETRDIPGAIKVVKRALSPASKPSTSVSADGVLSNGVASEYGRERKLIPLWHLLALLLSTRGDFVAAEKACEAAFEQFGPPTTLFGNDESTYRSEHLNQSTGKDSLGRGIVDRMEGFEKSGILQIKMTQLALLEMTEGSIAAVDECNELLALYSRLFGDPTGQKLTLDASTTVMAPPKSAIGTVRGSIFRGRGSVKTSPQEPSARNSSVLSSKGSTAATQSGTAPAIQVTEDDGTTHGNGHRHHLFHKHGKQDESSTGVSRSNSKKLQKRSSASLRRQSIPDANQAPEVPPLPEHAVNGAEAQENLSPSKSVDSREQPLRAIPHNMNHSSPPLDHNKQPPRQDMRLPAPFPSTNYVPSDPRFSKIQERRQKVSLLSDIWLFISGLYSRALMFQDAREAVAEAMKLVEAFEAEVSQESSTAKSLAQKGWGGGKSVEELWADAFSARGELLLAQTWHHQARTDFERALLHFPDHPAGIVGLSNILLDIYGEVIPLEPTPVAQFTSPSSSTVTPSAPKDSSNTKSQHLTSHIPSAENQLSPPVLNRLAARDRAFGLLSTLTKLGSGWDFSEAWYALARAYEESGQIEKAKEVLWWCVELEDTHPLRSWKSVGMGGFVL